MIIFVNVQCNTYTLELDDIVLMALKPSSLAGRTWSPVIFKNMCYSKKQIKIIIFKEKNYTPRSRQRQRLPGGAGTDLTGGVGHASGLQLRQRLPRRRLQRCLWRAALRTH